MPKSGDGGRLRLYLDVCAIDRPFDDQSTLRIRMETAAVFLILEYAHRGKYRLVCSPVHYLETRANTVERHRKALTLFLDLFCEHPEMDQESVVVRAKELVRRGLGEADALHVAYAEQCADVFVTCDDELLRRLHRLKASIIGCNPWEFCFKEALQ